MAMVKLGDKLSIAAEELATQVIACLGMRGSGKSNTMAVIAEGLLAAEVPVVILDYVGIWFSLRLAADGKHPSGLGIPVLGGQHGDIALVPTAGAVVAESLARTASSAVLDISAMTKAERDRFAADFGERFFFVKKHHPGPVLLVLEEAQRFVPQMYKGSERLLGAYMEIAEVGRNFGVGLGLISQRPQKIHKDVLNLCELLFAFQLNGVHERKAVAEWVQEVGADGREEVKDELPGLARGTALVWSPARKLYRRTELLKKSTYDAGATPIRARAAVKVDALDLGALSQAMAKVVEEAKANDPRELRAEVARLRRELEKRQHEPAHAADVVTRAPKKVEIKVPFVPPKLVRGLQRLTEKLEVLGAEVSDLRELAEKTPAVQPPPPPPKEASAAWGGSQMHRANLRRQEPPKNGEWRPRAGALRMLRALTGSHRPLTWRQVGTLAVMRRSGTFDAYKGELRRHGCVDEAGDSVRPTEYGRALAGDVRGPDGGRELLEHWLANPRIRGKTKDLLRAIVARGPGGEIDRDDWLEEVGLMHSGTADAYIGILRVNGLVEKRGRAYHAAEMFFEEAGAAPPPGDA